MKGFIRRTLVGWVPADEQARHIHQREKLGQVYRADIVQPRNYRHHCLGMSLLQLTFENQDRYDNFEIFRKVVAKAAGHVIQYVDLNGEICIEAGSLSYDAIPDDNEFGKVMSAMMTICAHLLHDIGLEELEHEVARYADQNYGIAA